MNKMRKPVSFWTHSGGCQGYTLVELLISCAISAMVAISLVGLVMTVSRLSQGVFYQQLALQQAQSTTEGINREIRLATTPLRVVNDAGASVAQGNCVLFSRLGEPADSRSFQLLAGDNDLMTPYDNTLVYDPDTSVTGDERVVAKWLSPLDPAGVFRYGGTTTPLTVWLRAGDPVGGDSAAANAHSGPGLQGVEINIAVAPRN